MTDSANGAASANDVKQKFREALDRKSHKNSMAVDHLDAESKVHGAHASADHKRDFRRKSG